MLDVAVIFAILHFADKEKVKSNLTKKITTHIDNRKV